LLGGLRVTMVDGVQDSGDLVHKRDPLVDGHRMSFIVIHEAEITTERLES